MARWSQCLPPAELELEARRALLTDCFIQDEAQLRDVPLVSPPAVAGAFELFPTIAKLASQGTLTNDPHRRDGVGDEEWG